MADTLFWKSSVRLGLGELVVPVNDKAIGTMFGDAGFSSLARRVRDGRLGSLAFSSSSLVYVSQSQMPFDR